MVFENGGTEVWELQGCSWTREHILQGFCSINKPLAVCYRCDSFFLHFFILKFPERRPKHCPLLDHCNIQQYGDPIEPRGLPQVACLDGVDGTRRALATVTTLGVSRLLRISAAAVCCCDGALNHTPYPPLMFLGPSHSRSKQKLINLRQHGAHCIYSGFGLHRACRALAPARVAAARRGGDIAPGAVPPPAGR